MWAYHGVLQQLAIKPWRSLNDDLVLQTNVMNYGGSSTVISAPEKAKPAMSANGAAPDFGKMSAAQRLAYFQGRLTGRTT